jgi:hypothetical protein
MTLDLSPTGPLVNLSCTDCKARFSSASSLLKHFAEHILNSSGDGSIESSCESEDTRSETNAASASAGRRSPALEERRMRPKMPELLKIHRKRNSTEVQVQIKKEKDEDTHIKVHRINVSNVNTAD